MVGVFVDSSGSCQGLALLWNFNDTMTLQSFMPSYIDVVVRQGDDFSWRLTVYYGHS